MSSTQENSDKRDNPIWKKIFGADFHPPFPMHPKVFEAAWPLRLGIREVQSRLTLDVKTQAIIVFSTMVALGYKAEAKLYIQGLRNIGLSIEEIAEIIVIVAYYAGFPRATDAGMLLQEVVEEDEERAKAKGFYYRLPRKSI